MPITVPYADLYREYQQCQPGLDQALARCISTSAFINGPEVEQFEKVWAEYTHAPDCAGVSSGTSALMLALVALGVGPGDEVIVPSMSFISTAEVVSQIGAVPVFVDIDQYYTIAIDQISPAVTDRTRAIIFVDLYGQTSDIDAIRSIAGGIPIIQDAAQSSGCGYKNKPIGSQADLTCFSFYPGKNLSAMGDAGAVTGPTDLIHRIRMLRNHGRTEKYRHDITGWNERLDGMQAAVLQAKISQLDSWNQQRNQWADTYRSELKDLPLHLPPCNPVSSHVYNQFVITTAKRDDLRMYLLQRGIETGIQFPLGMHQQPVYREQYCSVKLPATETLAKECLSLPVHAQLSQDQVVSVCESIRSFFS
jgi:dTDP-4-amino-4,6-dideoxygalactose transaminase